MTETTLNSLRKLTAYRDQRGHIFQSTGSLQWFVRKHRQQLIETGALVLIAGQWHAHEQKFDACVLQAGALAAKLHSEAA